jgi:hypothetical protein
MNEGRRRLGQQVSAYRVHPGLPHKRYGQAVGRWNLAAMDTVAGNTSPRSVNGKSWIGVKEVDLVRDAAKSLDAEASPGG